MCSFVSSYRVRRHVMMTAVILLEVTPCVVMSCTRARSHAVRGDASSNIVRVTQCEVPAVIGLEVTHIAKMIHKNSVRKTLVFQDPNLPVAEPSRIIFKEHSLVLST
jgi:hypothetical protein